MTVTETGGTQKTLPDAIAAKANAARFLATSKSLVDLGADNTGSVSCASILGGLSASSDLIVTAGTYLVDSSTTLTGRFRFMKGAILKITNGALVNCSNLEIEAGFYQIFNIVSGSLSAANNGLLTSHVYPQWFGASTGSTSDQSAKVQSAINFASTFGGTVYFSRGNWRFDTTISVLASLTLLGERAHIVTSQDWPGVTTFDFSRTTGNAIVVNDPNGNGTIFGFAIENISLVHGTDQNGVSSSVGFGLSIYAVKNIIINRCAFWGFGTNLYFSDNYSNPCIHAAVTDCFFAQGVQRSIFAAGITTLIIERCEIGGYTGAQDIVLIGDPVKRGTTVGTCDTIKINNCVMGCGPVTDYIFRISTTKSYGMNTSITHTDMEEASVSAILLSYGDYADASIKGLLIDDVWMSGVKTAVASVGIPHSITLKNSRLHCDYSLNNVPKGAKAIYIASSAAIDTNAEVIITENQVYVQSNDSDACGVALFSVKGGLIANNLVRMGGSASNKAAITVVGSGNIVTGNRCQTTYGSSDGINNGGGSANLVVNNLKISA